MRGSRRLKVFQPASLRSGDGCVRVHLLDVSHTGLLGHAPVPPWPGERVELDIPGLLVAASVRWRDGRRFGVQFDTPLGDDQLARLTRQGTAPIPRPEPALG